MDRPAPQVTLLEAAHIVARGGELDTKLDTLAGHALTTAGASAAIIYLLDPVARRLVPAAHAGLEPSDENATATIELDDADDLVARVVRERRPDRGSAAVSSRALGVAGSARGLIALPIVAADETGNEEAEGALVAVFSGQAPDPAAPEDMLSAIVDLCAVAIRQARLESALVERADWIGRLASIDALTGLANRVTFDRAIELEIARAVRQRTEVTFVLFDVDGLAAINAAAGAETGDDVLRAVASTLAEQVRLVDTVARFGPDEFGLIAPGSGGHIAARRVADAAAKHEGLPGQPISLSVGTAVFPTDGATSEELLAAAEVALQAAKRRGRGSIVVAGQA